MSPAHDEEVIYGIIESIRHGALAQPPVGLKCPECGAALIVGFHPKGTHLTVSCSSPQGMHWCWNGKVVKTPTWWKERIVTEGWIEFGEEWPKKHDAK